VANKHEKGPAVAQKSLIQPVRRSSEGSPLSWFQERLWLLNQKNPEDTSYNIPVAFLIEGVLDVSALAIRTATVARGRLVFSVGGGVVYDSKGSDEFEETLHKGRTLLSALERMGPPETFAGSANQSSSARSRFGWCNGKLESMADMTVSVESLKVSS
jgi:hypothetical protein